jgi:hypothetical protein
LVLGFFPVLRKVIEEEEPEETSADTTLDSSNVVSQSFLSKKARKAKTQGSAITEGSQAMAKPQQSQWYHRPSIN